MQQMKCVQPHIQLIDQDNNKIIKMIKIIRTMGLDSSHFGWKALSRVGLWWMVGRMVLGGEGGVM